jgi:hypothetical protein
LCGITVPTDISGVVYGVMASRRDEVIDNIPLMGYCKDNIQIVLWHVNNLKNSMTTDETKKIVEHIIKT